MKERKIIQKVGLLFSQEDYSKNLILGAVSIGIAYQNIALFHGFNPETYVQEIGIKHSQVRHETDSYAIEQQIDESEINIDIPDDSNWWNLLTRLKGEDDS